MKTSLQRGSQGQVPLTLYMIKAGASSANIRQEAEIELLYNFGESVGLGKIEVANAIAEAIQHNYVSSLESIV